MHALPTIRSRILWLGALAALVVPLVVAVATPGQAAERPDSTNTGVPSGTDLRAYDGPLTITRDGTTLDGVDVRGCLDIQANDVTIRNSRIRCDNGTSGSTRDHIVRVHGGASGTLVDHVELDGMDTPWTMGVLGSNVTVRHTEIHGVGDGIKGGSNSTYEYNYVHSMTDGSSQHNDGIQMSQGSNTVFRGNRISHRPEQTSAALFKADAGPIRNVVIEGNWFEGGNYTLYLIGEGPAPAANAPDVEHETRGLTVVGNTFSRTYNHGALLERAVEELTWQCNRWQDGSPLRYGHSDNEVDGAESDDTVGGGDCSAPAPEPTEDPTSDPEPEPTQTVDGTPMADETDAALGFSTSADRSSPQPLDGASVSGEVYAFVTSADGVAEVAFSVDGTETRSEADAPFDLEGQVKEQGTWVLEPTDTTTWSDGEHTVSAQLTMEDGSTTTTTSTVVVDNGPSEAAVSDLDGASFTTGEWWKSAVTVTVVDDDGERVPDATVAGAWMHQGGELECTTGPSGICVVAGPSLRDGTSATTFVVEEIAHPDLDHAASEHRDPDADSDGTAIEVTR